MSEIREFVLEIKLTKEVAKKLISEAHSLNQCPAELATRMIEDGIDKLAARPGKPSPEERIAWAITEIVTEIVDVVREELTKED